MDKFFKAVALSTALVFTQSTAAFASGSGQDARASAVLANDTSTPSVTGQTPGVTEQTDAQYTTASEHNPPAKANLAPPNLDAVIAQVRRSLSRLNFEASFVLVQGKFAEPYNWMHGIYQGEEIEYLRSQNGDNKEIVRKGDLIGYFDGESEPYSVKSRAIQGILPALFFDDTVALGDYYSIAVGGKSRILDRVAQQFRIVSRDNYRFDYWLWLDVKTGLLLKSALVSKSNEVLEQFQMTHLNVLEQPPTLAAKLAETNLPQVKASNNHNNQIRWKLNWLPSGFKLISANQHKLPLTGEFTDYILLSDGLVELSVFVQQPLSQKLKGGNVRSGSNIVAIHRGKGFDVSVIGKVPGITAERIAKGVSGR